MAVGQTGHLVGDDRDLELSLQFPVGLDAQGRFAPAAQAVPPCRSTARPPRRSSQFLPPARRRPVRWPHSRAPEARFLEQQNCADARRSEEFDFCAAGFHNSTCPPVDAGFCAVANQSIRVYPEFYGEIVSRPASAGWAQTSFAGSDGGRAAGRFRSGRVVDLRRRKSLRLNNHSSMKISAKFDKVRGFLTKAGETGRGATRGLTARRPIAA